MFNLSGSELIFLVIIALVVLGPDKLPEAMRKAGKVYADFKRMTSGFQSEMKSVLDEPMRELRETAEMAKQAATFDLNPLTSTASTPAATPPKQTGVGPTDRTAPAPASTPAASTPASTDAPPVAAAPVEPPAPAPVEAPAPALGDATSRRLARQPDLDAIVAPAEPAPAADIVMTNAVVASGTMTGFGMPTPEPAAPAAHDAADAGAAGTEPGAATE
ncbi:MAG: tatB [Ilumatobacteraceae bacterium]|nr:tatB [Ilumatobacteraceae bacterium]